LTQIVLPQQMANIWQHMMSAVLSSYSLPRKWEWGKKRIL